MDYDLVVTGGRVIDPSQEIDRVTDVAFAQGRVAAVGDGLAAHGAQVVEAAGRIVTPGLIDLHTHVYWGGTSLGVDAVALARSAGVSTLVDTGSAGPGNFPGFRSHVIDASPVRIIAYLNISFAGIFGFSSRIMVGESGDQRLMAPHDTLEVLDANRDVIAGVKVRVGRTASGTAGVVPLDIARQVADEADVPMMVHIDQPPPTLEEVLARLRPGDILTHCFRPFPNAPIRRDGRVLDAVLDARARGVLFDIGHGMGSFDFIVARGMLAAGFLPDTISSDVHALCIDGPAFDLPTTMSKFLCLGVSLPEVIRRATVNAAAALQRPDLGSFRPGSEGDASILELANGRFDYRDVLGAELIGEQRLLARGLVLAGELWHSADQAA
ncbi:amidohydrolase/deacetylase family metallohydrolase [Chelatococcus sp. GCM10030263]|uniref:amidohydrolase/deacetylase family metallohydrolase n=1 Tax=Chelatococcus sp. GCM10030263 TaxID=3273387 RepID=UPI0036145C2A